ncbi:MAG: ribonuclease III [Cyanobacteria bacterium]|nr:ribonuclease III [Cyanobacteriota bacterium]MDA0867033.1 ribonuclease III [Cyanobacteriota bacterium]
MTDLPPPSQALRRCIARLGLTETTAINWAVLEQALIHSSVSPIHNNEFLEFLGDSVLRLAAAEFLRERYPDATVGELSALRSHLVSDRTLTALADHLGLEPFLQIAPSAAGDLAARDSRLADVVEAILAALYLSRGNLSLVRPWLDPHLDRLAEQLRQDPARQNYKAALQELTQAHCKALPDYRTTEVNPVHGDARRFQAEVWFQERCWGKGQGRSIKLAQQQAAQVAYQAMQNAFNPDPGNDAKTP